MNTLSALSHHMSCATGLQTPGRARLHVARAQYLRIYCSFPISPRANAITPTTSFFLALPTPLPSPPPTPTTFHVTRSYFCQPQSFWRAHEAQQQITSPISFSMSDSSSNRSFPGGFEYANHRLSDFPLYPTSIPAESLSAPDRRQVQLASVAGRLHELRLWRAQQQYESALENRDHAGLAEFLTTLERLRSNAPRPSNNRAGFGRVPGPLPPMIPATRTERGPKKPVVTCVSALPPTTYKEQDEPDGTQNTLAYVKVQRTLLKFANTHPTDSLSARQASRWTQDIDPAGRKEPKAADALRLCYYMRSQGYDVYSTLLKGCIHLYVVHQGSKVRDALHDALYWKQNVSTNSVEFMAASSARGTRRNAVPDGPNYPSFQALIESGRRQNAALAGAPAIAPAPAPVPSTPLTAAEIAENALRAAQAAVQAEADREETDPM